jgi:hypothetical protein
VSGYVYRLAADGAMYSLAATSADEAGSDAARLLAQGACEVTIERVERSKTDLEDAWATKQILAAGRPS